jgi:hypothetical protein
MKKKGKRQKSKGKREEIETRTYQKANVFIFAF